MCNKQKIGTILLQLWITKITGTIKIWCILLLLWVLWRLTTLSIMFATSMPRQVVHACIHAKLDSMGRRGCMCVQVAAVLIWKADFVTIGLELATIQQPSTHLFNKDYVILPRNPLRKPKFGYS